MNINAFKIFSKKCGEGRELKNNKKKNSKNTRKKKEKKKKKKGSINGKQVFIVGHWRFYNLRI